MKFDNVYFINGTAYAGKSTLVKLLAQKYSGVFCGEDYRDPYIDGLDKSEFPCLTYTRDIEDWGDFVRRTPDEYERWIDGCTMECAVLEQRVLEDLSAQGRPVFVDTNIPIDILHKISDKSHVLIMLADPEISVNRFFDRPDRDKQFIYSLLLKEKNPQAALDNFRECLKRINSPKRYEEFLNSGFNVILRDDFRSAEETLALAEKCFGLC